MLMNSSAAVPEHPLDLSRAAQTAISVPAFAVGFFFSARATIVLLFVRVLGADPRAGAATAVALDLLLLAFVWFHSWGHSERKLGALVQPPPIRWVLLFLAFSGCSLFWSGTVSTASSIAYWCGMAADVAIVVMLLRSPAMTETSHALIKGFLWSTCFLALLAWLMPAQPDLRLGDDQFFNTNQIGNLCAFAIFLAQYLMRRRDGDRPILSTASAFLAVTLLRSLSKTTILAFLVAQAFLLIQDGSMSRKTKVLLTTGAMLTILAFWGLFEAYFDIYSNAANQAETLTGRTGIWAYVLSEAIQKPWIGHGFDSLWKVIPPFGPDQFEARHAENELLQQFYAYGAAGLVMLAGLYGSLYRQVRKLPRGPLRIVFQSMLLFVVVRGLAEAESFDLLLPLWSIVLIATLAHTDHASSGVPANALP